jgi:CO dehydrogenase/acetyl-CoA synthase gamma subunit (corrinoid Fe-S protein)
MSGNPVYQDFPCGFIAFLPFTTPLTNNRRMRRLIIVALACALFVASAYAVRELVIIEEPQLAQRVEGIVLDPNGAPIADMTVTDRAENGVDVLRTTKTDAKGYFHFPSQRGKNVYCLRFDDLLWNPLQLTLKLDKHAPQRGITASPHIGG